MAEIGDFGEKIEGAAKDRWLTYRDSLRDVSDPAEIRTRPLSESFPEPPYKTLLKEGGDPEMIAFIRAARDLVPSKPRKTYKIAQWAKTVEGLRGLCEDLMEGRSDVREIRDRMQGSAQWSPGDRINARMELYLALGHDRSMKNYKLGVGTVRRDGDQVFDPPVKRWKVSEESATRMGRILAVGASKEEAIETFRQKLDEGVSLKKRPDIGVFTYRGRPEKGAVIGQKKGRDLIEIETFKTSREARDRLRDHRDEIEEKLARLKDLPPERMGDNADRNGPARRAGDVTPDVFTDTFGFRGVQFGNYVEGARRQEELNKAHDALMDLSDVLGCHPSALSLDGELGLAFGARGRGGKGAPKAHYEPGHTVINLTKTNGAGSLAHEWFHALDNHAARTSETSTGVYATAETRRDGGSAQPFAGLIKEISSETGIISRASDLDRVRTSPYFATSIEVAARSFEAWVIDKLEDRGVRNDYLANFVEEDVFEAEARMRGQPAGRYPYPREDEMPVIRAAYDGLVASSDVRAFLGTFQDVGSRSELVVTDDHDRAPPDADQEGARDHGQFTLDF